MPVNLINGTDGNDSTVRGTDGRDLIHLLEGNDWIASAEGRDTIHGDAGDDTVFAYSGAVVLFGGDGNDQLVSSNHANANAGNLYGGAGDDHLFASSLVDNAYGGAGNDMVTIYFQDGGLVEGGRGVDTLDFGLFFGAGPTPEEQRVVFVLDGSDAGAQVGFTRFLNISGFEALRISLSYGDDYVRGGDMADRIELGAGANTALGEGGDDSMTYLTGVANFLDGGDGDDTLEVTQYLRQGALTLEVDGTTGEDQHGSQLTGFERWLVRGGNGGDHVSLGDGSDGFWGYRGNDTAYGEGGDDQLAGERDDDLLYGGDGDDRLSGGAGIDTLSGGAGADHFFYGSLDRAGDTVSDFASGEDKIVVHRRALDQALDEGLLAAERLSFGEAIGELGQFVLIDSDLFWDANGTGDGGETLLVTFTDLPDLAASDILIF